jgi:hypothetical protein
MHFNTRLASNPSLCAFPLPLSGSLTWTRVNVPVADGASIWRTGVSISNIPDQHILVPSYACVSKAYQWQASAIMANETSVLAPVLPVPQTAWPGFASADNETAALQPKIDCWHSVSSIQALELELTLFLAHSDTPPDQDLLTVSVRPIDQQATEPPARTYEVRAPQPAPVSQMQADKAIARRICSPTATAMAVMGSAALSHWHEAIESCYDPNTKAYGKWPLATYWASQRGILGSVEALWHWDDALALLQAGQPVVCSIRFSKGQLPGTPQEQSGGHLLVLYGIEFVEEEGFALVMDPAGANTGEVPRRYPLAAFTQAWLNHRGAAYLFSTKPLSQHDSDPVLSRATNRGH